MPFLEQRRPSFTGSTGDEVPADATVSILGSGADRAGQRGRVVRVLLRSLHGRLLSLSALSLPLSLPPALSLPLPRSAATGEPKRAIPANAVTAAAIERSALLEGSA